MGALLVFGIIQGLLLIGLLGGLIFAGRVRPLARTVWLRAGIVFLGFLAPLAMFVALRLATTSCTGFNFLGLPWPPAVHVAVQVVCAGVVVGSTIALIVATTRPDFRIVAVAMWIWSLLGAFPVLGGLFLSVYGDPGPVCNPV